MKYSNVSSRSGRKDLGDDWRPEVCMVAVDSLYWVAVPSAFNPHGCEADIDILTY